MLLFALIRSKKEQESQPLSESLDKAAVSYYIYFIKKCLMKKC